MLKVVFDTNIYISAILFGGPPELLLNLAFEKKFQLYISEEILGEIASVLRKKFDYPPSRTEQVTKSIKMFSIIAYPTQTVNIIQNWPPDNRILECCYEIKAGFLVSGDKKHLLPLKKFHSTQIVTTQEFLNKLDKPPSSL